jgi:cytochrome P450
MASWAASTARSTCSVAGPQNHKWFRDHVLFPMIDRAMSAALAQRDPDGCARINLIPWAQLASFTMAAALTGFDGMEDPARADELFETTERMLKGRPSSYHVSQGKVDLDNPLLAASVEARTEIIEGYYRPAVARRRRMVEQVEAGTLAEDALPNDLIMLIALGVDPRWKDEALAERETLFLLNAAVHTTSVSLYWTLRELFQWRLENPDQAERFGDEQFLLRATQEAMRLHPVTMGFPRRVLEATEAGGQHFEEGNIALILPGPANVDSSVWGPDAAEFNPDRTVPTGVEPYGLAFGAGAHLCLGQPIVVGSEGIDGSLMYFLTTLLKTGIEEEGYDHSQPALVEVRGTWSREPERYMVRFP